MILKQYKVYHKNEKVTNFMMNDLNTRDKDEQYFCIL